MKNNIKESLSNIDIPSGRKDAMLNNILSAANGIRRRKKKEIIIMRNTLKFTLAGIGLAACIAIAAMAIPAFTSQPQAPQDTVAIVESPKVSETRPAAAAFELSVKNPDSPQYIKLAVSNNDGNIGTKYTMPSEFFTFDKNDALVSCSGIDFMVENANAARVIFESKNYDLDYEDSRNWVTDDDKPTWSFCYININLEDLGSKREFSRDEVIAALKNIQASGNQKYKNQLMILVFDLHISEIQSVIDSGEDPQRFIEEKMKEPIDFDKYLAEYRVDTKDPDREFLFINLVNPDNQPTPRVIAKRIETRSGESVLWTYSSNNLYKKQKSEIDFAAITDKITVTVIYADGSQQKQVWNLGFDKDGKAVLTCEDVTNYIE